MERLYRRTFSLIALLALTPACGSDSSGDGDTTGTDDSDETGQSTGDTTNNTTSATTTGGPTTSTDTGTCPVGSEGCPCTGGGTCDAGLACEANVCADDGSNDSTGAVTATDGSTSDTATDGTTDMTTGGTETGDTGDECPGGILDTIPIESDGFVAGMCNEYEIQGAWYCYDDGVTSTSCVEDVVPFDDGEMCLTGDALGPVPNTWGGGIGLGLNETEDMPPIKMPYDAEAHDIIGFSVSVDGFTGGNELRIGFTSVAMPTEPSPFVAVAGIGTHNILFEDAIVPLDWDVPNAGETVDPSAIYDVQVQLAGDGMVAGFAYCITELTPIVSP